MRHLFLLPLLFILLTAPACKTSRQAAAGRQIEDTRWVLLELMGKPVTNPGKSGKEMFLQLDSAHKRASAYAGCNNFNGSYELMEGNRIHFGRVAATMMACPEMSLEDQLRQVLEMTDNYAILDGKLSLHKARMAPLARFQAKAN